MKPDKEILLSKLARKIQTRHPRTKYPLYDIFFDHNQSFLSPSSRSRFIIRVNWDKNWARGYVCIYIDDMGQLILESYLDSHYVNRYDLYEPDSLDRFFNDLHQILEHATPQSSLATRRANGYTPLPK